LTEDEYLAGVSEGNIFLFNYELGQLEMICGNDHSRCLIERF